MYTKSHSYACMFVGTESENIWTSLLHTATFCQVNWYIWFDMYVSFADVQNSFADIWGSLKGQNELNEDQRTSPFRMALSCQVNWNIGLFQYFWQNRAVRIGNVLWSSFNLFLPLQWAPYVRKRVLYICRLFCGYHACTSTLSIFWPFIWICRFIMKIFAKPENMWFIRWGYGESRNFSIPWTLKKFISAARLVAGFLL